MPSTVTQFTQSNVTSCREGGQETEGGGRDALLCPSSSKSLWMLKTTTVLTFLPGKELAWTVKEERNESELMGTGQNRCWARGSRVSTFSHL